MYPLRTGQTRRETYRLPSGALVSSRQHRSCHHRKQRPRTEPSNGGNHCVTETCPGSTIVHVHGCQHTCPHSATQSVIDESGSKDTRGGGYACRSIGAWLASYRRIQPPVQTPLQPASTQASLHLVPLRRVPAAPPVCGNSLRQLDVD